MPNHQEDVLVVLLAYNLWGPIQWHRRKKKQEQENNLNSALYTVMQTLQLADGQLTNSPQSPVCKKSSRNLQNHQFS